MEKFRKNLVILSLLAVLIALYASECREAVYFRKNGFEHPLENLVSLCILISFIVIIVLVAVTSRRKKEEMPQQDLSWKYFISSFIYLSFQNYVFNKGQAIAKNARITPTSAIIEKAVTDIITLYAIAVAVIIIGFVATEFINKKSK